jgi:hypothetical protein
MLLDENLERRGVAKTRKPQYRAITTGTPRYRTAPRWIYGLPCILPDASGRYPCKVNAIRTTDGSVYPIKTNTLSEYTGCDDCNGTPIYEGDIINKNRNYVRLVQYDERYGAYVTLCKSQRSNYSIDYLAKGDTLCRDIEVLGNLWQNPELLKQRCHTDYSLEEVYKD